MALRSFRNFLRAHTRPVEITDRKYAYEALPTTRSIRLLQLTPSKSDTICCTLKIVSLDEAPAYTALSYCWGAPKGTIPIVYGDTRDVLYVTPNLHSYLKQLNHGAQEDLPGYLWIDALCINQDDDLERGLQVSIMRDIYRRAEEVDIWLGEATEDSETAIGWMTDIHAAMMKASIKGDLVSPNDTSEKRAKAREKYKSLQASRSEWRALMVLIDRPWFNRVWIIQEKWMAQRAYFVCGNRRWDPGLLIAVLYTLSIFGPPRYGGHVDQDRNLRRLTFIISLKDRPSRLLSLLEMSIEFLATDSRDKVYALLGLADGAGYDETILKSDYEMSATDVFSRCAFAIMSAERILDVLSLCKPRNNLALPSWVPDWTCRSDMACLLGTPPFWESIELREWRASGGSSASVQVNAEGKMLALSGFIVDHIETIAAALNLSAENEETSTPRDILTQTEVLLEWEAFSRRRSGEIYEPTKESITYVYQKLLSAGRADYRGDLSTESFLKWEQLRLSRTTMKPDSMAEAEWLTHLYGGNLSKETFLKRERLRLPRETMKPDSIPEAEWLTHLYMKKSSLEKKTCTQYLDLIVQTNRRLIRTKGGYLGLVPYTAKIGDVVAICQGGRVPLTLRPYGENFQLVGDAYVHGMMRGERYEESKCKPIWLV